jgi:glucose-6-phosphate 1-dehydrogenase
MSTNNQTYHKIPPPSVFVVFGAAGDLTKRKLIPALYNLKKQNLLPKKFAIVGVDRTTNTEENFREHLTEHAPEFIGTDFDAALWEDLCARIYFAKLDFGDLDGFRSLQDKLAEVDALQGTPGSYLFYMAVPPRFFGVIAERLHAVGLATEKDGYWRHIIIEKPFGHDLASANALNAQLHQCFNEDQIFRIDHYLGKETVQNILAYRFANSTVEPIWNHRYVDHVQITVAESVGVENRASYYDHSGALRDMIPNHLLAVLSVIAMEPPNSFSADALRDEQTKVMRAIQPLEPRDVLTQTVRGQYGPGVLNGQQMIGYREEPNIAPDSKTETFIALKLMIDSWRWVNVPFYIRTGKRMPARYTEIAVFYKEAPNAMFRDSPLANQQLPPNKLILRLQPDEGIGMSFNAKTPGPSMILGDVLMDFRYSDYFGADPTTGYETLIYDCMNDDATLFKRADNIEVSWEVVEPILDVWGALPARCFPNYAAGTWGPAEADELLQKDGRRWNDCRVC